MKLKVGFNGKVAGQRVRPVVPLALSDAPVTLTVKGKKIEVPARVLAEAFIGLIDKGDCEPGDGQADFKIAIPLGFLPKDWGAAGVLTVELAD